MEVHLLDDDSVGRAPLENPSLARVAGVGRDCHRTSDEIFGPVSLNDPPLISGGNDEDDEEEEDDDDDDAMLAALQPADSTSIALPSNPRRVKKWAPSEMVGSACCCHHLSRPGTSALEGPQD